MTCQSCHAPIVWLRTAAGKSMPVNAETVTTGEHQFDPKKHVSHFATCPQGKQWKGKKRA